MDIQDTKKGVAKIGMACGAAAFLAFGLMHGALVGGTVGLETGAYLLGGAAGTETTMRVLAGAGMLMGAVITCAMFLTCGLAAGRAAGFLIAAVRTADADNAGHARLR